MVDLGLRVVTPYGIGFCCQRFGGMYRFHLQGEVVYPKRWKTIYKFTWPHNPESHSQHNDRRENLSVLLFVCFYLFFFLPLFFQFNCCFLLFFHICK
jgi:hypothetical protein